MNPEQERRFRTATGTVSPATFRELKRTAEKEDRPVAQVVRYAIEEYLASRKNGRRKRA